MTGPLVEIRQVSHSFGTHKALDEIALNVEPGSYTVLLGPSGSGKTTLLSILGGFLAPQEGKVFIRGNDCTSMAPARRPTATVFQDYALFPHLSVGDNVGFGLRMRGVSRAKRHAKVRESLSMVGLADSFAKKPHQLSGGQRQRVALARALVVEPAVLLLDEPLGALDLKLREQMQVELKAIQRDVGITFLFVTHDQEEALTLSDRIAVFNAGRIEQVGTALEIYEQPASAFVAGFVGTSNLLTGAAAKAVLGRDGAHGIRPEKLTVLVRGASAPHGSQRAAGSLSEVVYAGPVTRYVVDLEAGPRLVALQQNGSGTEAVHLQRGEQVDLAWDPAHVMAVPDQPHDSEHPDSPA